MSASIRRLPLYFLLNLGFISLVSALGFINGGANSHILYLILLFALCSHFIIDLDGLNGRYSLLGLFMLIYFVSFGVGDLSSLLYGGGFLDYAAVHSSPSSLPDKAENTILAGGIMLVIGYRIATYLVNSYRRPLEVKDWSKTMTVGVGVILWIIGSVATYRWHVYIITDTTNDAFRRGLSSLSPIIVTVYLLGAMLQPLGIFLCVYAWNVYRTFHLLLLVAAVLAVQIFIGFVIDSKGTAMLGIIALIVTAVLVGGRVPKIWLALGFLFVSILYPYFTAYRAAIHGAGIARTTVVASFGDILRKTIAAKDSVNSGRERAQTFLERSNVKGNVEVILAKGGETVPFQWGYTLAPILETFVPKLFWSEKEHIPTGQLFNKQFHLVDGDEVYISPSHLGELYWNFGLPGVLLGMGFAGALCGWVGARFNSADARTVTRILVTVTTMKYLIISFESTIADCYVVWLRSITGIGLMHLVFARVPVVAHLFSTPMARPEPSQMREAKTEPLFPNLLT